MFTDGVDKEVIVRDVRFCVQVTLFVGTVDAVIEALLTRAVEYVLFEDNGSVLLVLSGFMVVVLALFMGAVVEYVLFEENESMLLVVEALELITKGVIEAETFPTMVFVSFEENVSKLLVVL